MGLIDKLPEPMDCYKNMPWPELEFVSREEWGAKPPISEEKFESFPIKKVILGYTETEPCMDKESCIKIMQELQEKHMAQGEPDIRFSYVVGCDQRVYVGRGFKVKPGVHPRYPGLKGKSVEVVLTGQRGELPRPGINSSIMYRLIDMASFEDNTISFEDTTYTLDYDDPVEDEESGLLAEIEEQNKKTTEFFAPYVKMWRERDEEAERERLAKRREKEQREKEMREKE